MTGFYYHWSVPPPPSCDWILLSLVIDQETNLFATLEMFQEFTSLVSMFRMFESTVVNSFSCQCHNVDIMECHNVGMIEYHDVNICNVINVNKM